MATIPTDYRFVLSRLTEDHGFQTSWKRKGRYYATVDCYDRKEVETIAQFMFTALPALKSCTCLTDYQPLHFKAGFEAGFAIENIEVAFRQLNKPIEARQDAQSPIISVAELKNAETLLNVFSNDATCSTLDENTKNWINWDTLREEAENKISERFKLPMITHCRWSFNLATKESGEQEILVKIKLVLIQRNLNLSLSSDDVRFIIKTLEDYSSAVNKVKQARVQNKLPLVTQEEITQAEQLLNTFCQIEDRLIISEKNEIRRQLGNINGLEIQYLSSPSEHYSISMAEGPQKGIYFLQCDTLKSQSQRHSKYILSDNVRKITDILEPFVAKYKKPR